MIDAGFYMLACVPVLLIATGLPAFMILIFIAATAAAIGVATGALPYELLTALPQRIEGLLETDILQALPLYALMGALLNRLPLADILFRAGNALFARTAAAPLLSAVGLGTLLAPMNGSVGASVAALTRIVLPRLRTHHVSNAKGLATVCVASTLGVVVPPSLVLILLGNAMLRADTQAMNITGHLSRAINTQDVFRGALPPAAIFLVMTAVLTWLIGRRTAAAAGTPLAHRERVRPRDWAIAAATVAFVLGLLMGVVLGYFYAVEAAAAGGMALFVIGLVSRTLTMKVLGQVLHDTMAITGALFALLVGATTFTLVVRAFGTDQVITEIIQRVPGGGMGAVLAVMLVLWLCAFALDAFEIIFVVIPLVMPALLTRVDDAVWVSVLALLSLQASFLLPPLGYAVMMARTSAPIRVDLRALVTALLPFLGAQLVVLGLTIAFPGVARLALPAEPGMAAARHKLTNQEVERLLQQSLPPPARGQ
ncbi:MAG: TRAP transporter large permease subunit [Alphaproteobacteria bacterium]|nr:TRAP transporter large permease subunit [Alphaproteobacteria bacterium]